MTCPHDNISLPTTSDPDTVCADCGAVLKPEEIPQSTADATHAPAAFAGGFKGTTMTTKPKQSTATVVHQMRRLEATIINAGRHGVTIDDLTAAIGTSRRTIDRLLQQLQELGSGIDLDWQPGPVAGTWTHAGQAVFVHRRASQ